MSAAERLERIRDNVKAAEFDDGTYWAPHYAKDCGLLLAEVERLRARVGELEMLFDFAQELAHAVASSSECSRWCNPELNRYILAAEAAAQPLGAALEGEPSHAH